MKEPIEFFANQGFRFTEDWFSPHIPLWDSVIERLKPKRILEIGSFEGRSTCYMIRKAVDYGHVDIACIDTWEGGVEHAGLDFDVVEKNFDHNVQLLLKAGLLNNVNVYKLKGKSYVELARLITEDFGLFDLVYIDGSHMASDVLLDATMAFKLLRVDGVLIFDDYQRGEQKELEHPMIAIDAFTYVNRDKVRKINFQLVDEKENVTHTMDELLKEKGLDGLYQLYLEKVAE